MTTPRPPNPARLRASGAGPHAAGHARRPPDRLPSPPSTLLAALAVAALLLLLAPPASNYVWGVNGLRSLTVQGALMLVLVSAATALAAFVARGGRAWAVMVAVALALLVAFPLRERIDFLGDTQLRVRSMLAFGAGIVETPFAEWSGRLHASPLDIAVDLMAPVTIHRAGWPLRDAVSAVGVLLALLYFGGLWRVLSNAGVARELRLPLGLALALTGVLEAFAGYAESAGLLAVATVWWWAEAFAPLSGIRQALRLALAWLVVLLCHRMGSVLLLPMLWRSLGPMWPGDRPRARRVVLGLTLATVALGAALLGLTGAGPRVMTDAREMVQSLRAMEIRHVAPSDWINTLVLLAPFAMFLPFLVGRDALRAGARHPVVGLAASAAVPLLLALMWVFPVGSSGLGAQRDWDSSVILGITLTVAAGVLASRLPPAHLRARLAWVLPLLALVSLGFVAVQADARAAERRALAAATQPPNMPGTQRSHALLYLGQRAMDQGRWQAGAEFYDRAFELNPNPRRALLAAEAWVASGNGEAARRSIERARAMGPLAPELEQGARRLEAALLDSAATRRNPTLSGR